VDATAAVPVSEIVPGSAASAADAGEAALVQRARDGDAAALNRLVQSCLADAFDVAYRILGDRDTAEDAVQDGMVSAMKAISRFRGEGSFRAWVLTIVANAARTLLRQSGRRRQVALEDAEGVEGGVPDYENDILARRRAERIRDAIAELPEKQRLAVTLRTYQGLSYREIAAIADCSEGAARVNYHLGVKRLKLILQ